jgi:hypothetical protein
VRIGKFLCTTAELFQLAIGVPKGADIASVKGTLVLLRNGAEVLRTSISGNAMQEANWLQDFKLAAYIIAWNDAPKLDELIKPLDKINIQLTFS